MNTTATPAVVKQQLVTLLTAALTTAGAGGIAVPVFYAWNPAVQSDSVFLGRPIFSVGDEVSSRVPVDLVPPVAEATTMSRALYKIEGTCWSFRPDLTPDQAADAESRVDGFWSAARAVLAPLPWIRSMTVEFQLRGYEKGWAALAAFTLEVNAQLT